MRAYNALREYIIGRQVVDVVGVTGKTIITTPSGKLVEWGMPSGDSWGVGGGGGPGACCIAGTCSTATQEACLAAGGIYFGAGVPCSPTTCSGGIGGVGACCIGGTCTEMSYASCVSSGGTFHIGPCNPCGPGGYSGACCVDGGCTVTTADLCYGAFHQLADCSDPEVTCTTEPTGACCHNLNSTCEVTTFGGCGGQFFENIGCEYVGSCEAAFCGPTGAGCNCEAPPGIGYVPNPACCTPNLPICATCYNITGGYYYCCCCRIDPIWGTLCQ